RARSPRARASDRRAARSRPWLARNFSSSTRSRPASARAVSSASAASSPIAGFLQPGGRFAKKGGMSPRSRSRRARGGTVRGVLDIAIELEKKTMALYVAFVQAFPRPEEVRNFWFSMARHEAGHCGALALVESIVESDPSRAAAARVWFDEHTVA